MKATLKGNSRQCISSLYLILLIIIPVHKRLLRSSNSCNMAQKRGPSLSPWGERQTNKELPDYGKLKVDLAERLTPHDVTKLSTFFNLKKAASYKITHSETPGIDLVNTLETQGMVSSGDISQLIDGLRKCNLGGVADNIQQSYPSNVSYQPVPRATKQAFINQLKMSYETLCDKVKPVPFIRDKVYSISDIYVQGGIHVLDSSIGAERSNAWSPLESYQEIMSSPKTKSKRKIIEGDPGYGKSTLLLQYLHDWCSGNPKSILKDVEVVIFLKFRQLKGITSIYKAIKLTLLPKDSTITESDVKTIIQSCKSVVIFLDGYDEYPDKSVQKTDFVYIISMEMFQTIDVIITTRRSNLPPNLTSKTKRIRLMGFGRQNRRNYILKVVAPESLQAADMIETQLEKNPLVGDLCESPLFFTMVAHIAHEMGHLEIFKTATRFFHFIVKCFHSHMINKEVGVNVTDDMLRKFQEDHSELDRLAFEGLCGKQHQQLSWERSVVVGRVGPEFCDYYVRMGMLVEEEVLDVSRTADVRRFLQTLIQLGFPHKIFCEWYASFSLVSQIASITSESIEGILSQFNPLDLQYLYRFTCGLSKTASERVIKYLQKTKEGKGFAVLCMLEQEENSEQFLQTVRDLVSGDTTSISETDTKLLQRSTMQILDLASVNKIPISELALEWSFRGFDGDNIRLESGLCISSLSSVEKIAINGDDKQLSEEEVIGLINFGIKSTRFKELWFHNCKLPSLINPASIPDEAKANNTKVISSGEALCVDLNNGQWKQPEDIQTITTMCSGGLIIDNDTSESVQRSVIELLVKATNHDIPIFSVYLIWSFDKIAEDGLNIILKSGLLLPNISSMERMDIQTEKGREIKEEEINEILNYQQQNKRLKELIFLDCVLPSHMNLGPAASVLRSRNVQVIWIPDGENPDKCYLLDLGTGNWLEIKS